MSWRKPAQIRIGTARLSYKGRPTELDVTEVLKKLMQADVGLVKVTIAHSKKRLPCLRRLSKECIWQTLRRVSRFPPAFPALNSMSCARPQAPPSHPPCWPQLAANCHISRTSYTAPIPGPVRYCKFPHILHSSQLFEWRTRSFFNFLNKCKLCKMCWNLQSLTGIGLGAV